MRVRIHIKGRKLITPPPLWVITLLAAAAVATIFALTR